MPSICSNPALPYPCADMQQAHKWDQVAWQVSPPRIGTPAAVQAASGISPKIRSSTFASFGTFSQVITFHIAECKQSQANVDDLMT